MSGAAGKDAGTYLKNNVNILAIVWQRRRWRRHQKKSFQRTGNCPAPPAGVSGDAGADVRRVNKKIEYYWRLSGAGQPSGD